MQLRADQKTLIDFDTVFYKIPPMHQHLKFLDSHSEPQTMPFHTMNIQHVTTPRRLFYCKNQNCVIEEIKEVSSIDFKLKKKSFD